ncbi:NFACT family protein [Myxococcota bacterium]|nr:NFACT family protein [Myxococcota bacterium]
MALKTYEVYALVDELQSLEGAQIQKIQQTSAEELQFHLRIPGESLWLYLSIEQGLERLHLLPEKLPSLPEPPSFCMRLRKELLNGRIQSIRALQGEPIVCIEVGRADARHALIVEMIARKGQLMLVDDAYNVLASMQPLSIQRGLRLRDPYSPPEKPTPPPTRTETSTPTEASALTEPPQNTAASQNTEPPQNTAASQNTEPPQNTAASQNTAAVFSGNSVALDTERQAMTLEAEGSWLRWAEAGALEVGAEEMQRLLEAKAQGEEALAAMGLAAEHTLYRWPLQIGIGQRFQQRSEKQRFQSLRQIALKTRRKQLKKAERLVEALQEDLGRCQESLQKEQEAELLKGHLHAIKRGATEIEVTDYYDPAMGKRTIALDPMLSATENLDKLFRKIKRARKGIEATAPRLDETRERIDTLRFEIEWIEQVQDMEELLRYVPAGLAEQAPASEGKEPPQRARPFHTFTSQQGYRILVGRSSQANDELTFRLSRGNDLWLHVRGCPGSHVVIPRQKSQEALPNEVLLDAATLATYFSKARQQTHVDVIFTQVRHVKKPKGANPGQVAVLRDENIALRVEPERLQRLLHQSPTNEDFSVSSVR